MAKLVLSTGGSIVHQCFLDQGGVTVGREASNQIVVDDPLVSREHAAIFKVGNDYILEDLGGVNGTSVNGMPVQRRILQHGDVIELGAYHLRYLNTKETSEVDLERTMLIAGLMPAAGAARAENAAGSTDHLHVPSTRAARGHFPNGRVQWTRGPRAGQTMDLDRVVATFGIAGKQVAVITRRPHGYFLTHVEGRSQPRVNGQAIGADARVLRNGDSIEVGDDTLLFELR